MKYPFFASFLVLCAVFYHNRKKADRNSAKIMQDFFDRENLANNTRKQPLDNLEYIKIDLDSLPMDVFTEDSLIAEYLSDINNLAKDSIVNFTGLTNTDLKLQYGPANLPFLQKCDFNYTHLVTVLHNWGKKLYESGYSNEALTVLEYAISINADISNIYNLTADIYIENETPDKVRELITKVEAQNFTMKNSILTSLNEKLA